MRLHSLPATHRTLAWRCSTVTVALGDSTEVTALAYIAIRGNESSTSFAHPSEQYMCAIYQHLCEHHADFGELVIKRLDDDASVVQEGAWAFPGVRL